MKKMARNDLHKVCQQLREELLEEDNAIKYVHVSPADIKLEDLDFDSLTDYHPYIEVHFKDKSIDGLITVDNPINGAVQLLLRVSEWNFKEISMDEEFSNKLRERLREELPWHVH